MLTAGWRTRLAAGAHPVLLVTVVFSRDALTDMAHPAMTPGAIRAASEQALVTSLGGAVYPFWPTLATWPELSREYSPTERRAPVSQTQVRLTALAGFPHDEIAPESPPGAHARVDAWIPGVALEQVIPILAGPITEGRYERKTGGITLTIEDGDTQRRVEWPPGKFTIELDDFPDAPDIVIGQARRQTIFGPFNDGIPCIPISRDGRRFYVCEPACVVPPYRFQIGGSEVPRRDRPVVRTSHFASDPTRTYTEIVFPTSAAQSAYIGGVTASGGIGLGTDSAPLTLLRDIGGYEVSEQAERDFMELASRVDFQVFQNASGGVLEIVRDRLAPQTDLVVTQHLNKVDTIRLLGPSAQRRLAVGEGLLARVQDEQIRSRSENVYNVIEVKYRRTLPVYSLAIAGTRDAYVIDHRYGGALGSLLAESQRRHGRRSLTLEAADLVETTPGGIPQGVVQLAETTARLNALPPKRLVYDQLFLEGFSWEIGDQCWLTDADEDIDEAPYRVVKRQIRATGVRLTLESEAVL